MYNSRNMHKTRKRMSPLGADISYTYADLFYSGFYITPIVLVSIPKVTRSHVGSFFFQEIPVVFRSSLQT